jgi:hypothetical protein
MRRRRVAAISQHLNQRRNRRRSKMPERLGTFIIACLQPVGQRPASKSDGGIVGNRAKVRSFRRWSLDSIAPDHSTAIVTVDLSDGKANPDAPVLSHWLKQKLSESDTFPSLQTLHFQARSTEISRDPQPPIRRPILEGINWAVFPIPPKVQRLACSIAENKRHKSRTPNVGQVMRKPEAGEIRSIGLRADHLPSENQANEQEGLEKRKTALRSWKHNQSVTRAQLSCTQELPLAHIGQYRYV